jgi:hypothetical protein
MPKVYLEKRKKGTIPVKNVTALCLGAILLVFASASAHAACQQGWVSTPGGCMPAGATDCGGPTYCPRGMRCVFGANGRATGCAPTASSPAPSTRPPTRPDPSAGQVDATQCISIQPRGGPNYIARNQCTYAIYTVIETVDFFPRQAVQERPRIGARGSVPLISYHGTAPRLISAQAR